MPKETPWSTDDRRLEAFRMLCECYNGAFGIPYVNVCRDPNLEFELELGKAYPIKKK